VSILVCRTYGWDPQNGAYRAATGPDKNKAQHFKNNSSVFIKLKSHPALLDRAKLLARTLEGVGVCVERPQGPGRARAGSVSDFQPLCSRYLPGSKRANHRSLRATTARIPWRDSRQAQWCATRVGGTPQTSFIGPPRGLTKTRLNT
jgi:hypothetical protein